MPPMIPDENNTRGKLVRLLRIVGGVLLILAGVLMLVLPGPGWVAIIAGIFLLGPNTRLARWLKGTFIRLRRWGRRLRKDHKLRRQARRCRSDPGSTRP